MKVSKKGVALPVETLVLLAIAIIVLLSIVAWFVSTFGGQTQGQKASDQFQSCCAKYVTAQCTDAPTAFPATGTGACGFNDANKNSVKDATETDYTLAQLASGVGITTDANIRRACGCTGA